ncbi:MAG TPA: peptidoglycan DD-metalloendopeptidase family protein [Candidatus Dormibacteraeota bacterium]|nr:peptidoglycan DD-metalloendopeptidase family protein [Candidatus Dormibacteraeota bacterium]
MALLVLAANVPLVLQAGADGVPGLPGQSPTASGTSSTPAPTPTPTPAPTPCPTDVTGVLCQATAPSPTPTPSPAPPSGKPTPAPTAGSGGAAPPAPPPPPASGPAQPGAAPPPPPAGPGAASSTVVSQVAATFKNAPFLGQLLQILNHPTAAQRPDLRHFRPSGAAGGSKGSGPTWPGSPGGAAGLIGESIVGHGSIAATAAIALLGMLAAIAAAILAGSAPARLAVRRRLAALWRLHPSLHRIGVVLHNSGRRVRGALQAAHGQLGLPGLSVRQHGRRGLTAAATIAALPAMLAGAVMANAQLTARGAPAVAQAPTHLNAFLRSELAQDAVNVQTAGVTVAPPTWTRLVTIERGLVGQQDELTAQEAAIGRLAVNVAGSSPDEEDTVQVGPDSRPQLRNRLSQLIAAHTATQTAYQSSLQAEYDFYRAAAQDPAQRAQLTAAVAATQQPQVKDAVTYNLSLVQTQLSQEAVIAKAEAQLQALGSLGQAQLDAMRHHQAFIAPLVAPVTQTFGPTDFSLEPPLSFNGTFFPHFHTGLDLGAPLDTPVHAAADGVVLLAAASVDDKGKLVGYGNYVAVAHPDGFVTLYGHLDSIAVQVGQVVHQGEIIGQEGSTGWSTGPHVHFEIRHNGQFLDPAPFLAGQLPPS